MKIAKLAARFQLYLLAQNDDEWDPRKFRALTQDGIIRYMDERGRFHRIDGPAQEDLVEGTKEYWVQDEPHRSDGPAFISPGVQQYMQKGKLHRVLGPAVEHPPDDGNQDEWWIYDSRLTSEQIGEQKKKISQVQLLLRDSSAKPLMDQALSEGNRWWQVPDGARPATEVLQDMLIERGLVPNIDRTPKPGHKNFTNIRKLLEIYQEMIDYGLV